MGEERWPLVHARTLLYFPFPQSGSRQRTMDAFSRPTASTHLFLPPPLPFFLLSLPSFSYFSLSLFLFSPQTFLSLYRVLCPISSSLHKYISAWQTPPLKLTTRVLVAFVLRPYTSWTDFLFVAKVRFIPLRVCRSHRDRDDTLYTLLNREQQLIMTKFDIRDFLNLIWHTGMK